MRASRSLIVWVLSQTDGPMCVPDSLFQPHGLLWHPLAGVMVVLLYFYRRVERPERASGGEAARQVWDLGALVGR